MTNEELIKKIRQLNAKQFYEGLDSDERKTLSHLTQKLCDLAEKLNAPSPNT